MNIIIIIIDFIHQINSLLFILIQNYNFILIMQFDQIINLQILLNNVVSILSIQLFQSKILTFLNKF